MHKRYRRQTDRQQTDGRAIAYSERERELTFAKNQELFLPFLYVATPLKVIQSEFRHDLRRDSNK